MTKLTELRGRLMRAAREVTDNPRKTMAIRIRSVRFAGCLRGFIGLFLFQRSLKNVVIINNEWLQRSTTKLQKVDSIEDRLNYVLEQAGVNQSGMARLLGVDKGYLSRIFSGKNPLTPKFLTTFSLTFGVKADWLKHGVGELPKVVLATSGVAEPGIYRSKFYLEAMTNEDLARQYDSVTEQLQHLRDAADPKRKVLIESIAAINEEQDRRIHAELRRSEDAEKKTTTLAQIGAAKVLPEAQQADAESPISQTIPSTTGKTGAPTTPSPPHPGHRRTPPKPAPK